MHYSFEILSGRGRTPGRCRLFCKLDVTPVELIYFSENALLDLIIWEAEESTPLRTKLVRGLTFFVVASSNDKKRHTQKDNLFVPHVDGMTLGQMVRGHLLDIRQANLKSVETVIEARILEIGEAYNLFVGRVMSNGRTDSV